MQQATATGGEHDTKSSADVATGARPPAMFVQTHDARIVTDVNLRAVITADKFGWKMTVMSDDDWYTEFVRASTGSDRAEDTDAAGILRVVQSRIEDTNESYLIWYADTIINFLRGVYDDRTDRAV